MNNLRDVKANKVLDALDKETTLKSKTVMEDLEVAEVNRNNLTCQIQELPTGVDAGAARVSELLAQVNAMKQKGQYP